MDSVVQGFVYDIILPEPLTPWSWANSLHSSEVSLQRIEREPRTPLELAKFKI